MLQQGLDLALKDAALLLQLGAQGENRPAGLRPGPPRPECRHLHGYDGLGRTAFVTETGILTGTFDPATRTFSAATVRVTKTEYDALSRPVTVTLNDQPGVPAGPDVNVQTLTVYDAAGNITWQRDSLGRWTFTEYDALNRPVTVTVNYENGDPVSIDPANAGWATLADTDLRTVTHSTAAGQVARVIENHVDGRFTSSEPITDRITLYAYDALGRVLTTTLSYAADSPPSSSGTNRSSLNAYDPVSGRLVGQQDALGRWVS